MHTFSISMLMSKKCRWFVVHLEVDSEGRTFFGALILREVRTVFTGL